MIKLAELSRLGPIPTSLINPGVVGLFLRYEFAEIILLPSRFASHQKKPRNIPHLRMTEQGQRFLGKNRSA